MPNTLIQKLALYTLGLFFASSLSAQQVSSDSTFNLSGQYLTSGGQATYSLPINVMPGRAGSQPELAFMYQSNKGNGLLGVGWQIGGLSAISRCGKNLTTDGRRGGVSFNHEDRYCLDGQRLIAVLGNYDQNRTEYRLEKNGYEKIVSYGSVEGAPEFFKVWHKDGSVYEYGKSTDSKAKLPETDVTYQWKLNKQTDITGKNASVYEYSVPTGSSVPRLKVISYVGGKLEFEYEDRDDVTQSYLGGKTIKKNKRLRRVSVLNSVNKRVGYYQLSYQGQSASERSLLSQIKYCANGDCTTPVSFDWESYEKLALNDFESTDFNEPRFYDSDGDGKANLYGVVSKDKSTGKMTVRDLTGKSHGGVTSFTLGGDQVAPKISFNTCTYNVASSYRNAKQQLVSFCRFSTCTSTSCSHASKGTTSGDFDGDGVEELIKGFLTADFNGDGRDDKHRFDIPNGGYRYELSNGLSGSLSPIKGMALKTLVDINLDGYLDVVMGPHSGNGHLFVHHFTGKGFAEPIELALTVGAKDSIFFADITGDGYPELVHEGSFYRNKNGDIETAPKANSEGEVAELAEPILVVDSKVYAVRDVNGDGWVDILTRENDNAKVQIHYSQARVQDKIKRISEFGLAYAIDYRPATDSDVYTKSEDEDVFPYKSVTPKRYLVYKVEKQPKGYEATSYQYHYKAAKLHLNGGGFLGFGETTETEIAAVVTKTVTSFEQHDLKLAGKPIKASTYKGSSGTAESLVSQVSYKYDTKTFSGYQAEYYQTYANEIVRTWYTPGSKLFDKKEVTTRKVNRFGNLTEEKRTYTSEHIGAGTYTQTTNLSYESNGENYQHFWYEISPKSSDSDLSKFHGFPRGLLRYCTESGETYFKPKDVFVFIGIPAAPILAKSNSEYFKYQSSHTAQVVEGESYFAGNIVPVTKIQFSSSQAYPCGEVNVVGVDGGKIKLVSRKLTGADIVTENAEDFWKLSAVSKETTSLSDGRSTRVSESSYSYYNNGLVRAQTVKGNNYGSIKSNVTSHSLIQEYEYDAYGNLTKSVQSGSEVEPRQTTYQFDNYLYPRSTTNAKGHKSTTVYDSNGRLKDSISALKGRKASYGYDSFGRVNRETLPGIGNINSTTYQLGDKCPYATEQTASCTIAELATGGKKIVLFDYAGREVRSLHQGFNGQWVSVDSTWDTSGRKLSVTKPYFVANRANQASISFEYDLLNREIKRSEPNSKGQTAEFNTSYDALTTTMTDAKGHEHVSKSNVMGYLISKKEPLGASQRYTYYPDGKLSTTTDAKGNTTTIRYDSLGHRSYLDDPDMGIWHYTYNVFGELVEKTDANFIKTEIVYDTLGRKTRQTEGGVTSTWQYDKNGALGTLTKFSGRGQSTEYVYNPQGLTKEVNVVVGNERFSTHYLYDKFERVYQEQRPNGAGGTDRLAVQYVYNPYGYLSAVRSPRNSADREFTSVKFRSEIRQLLDEALDLANSYVEKAETYRSQKLRYQQEAQTIRSGTLNEHRLDIAASQKLGVSHKLAQWCTEDGECYLRPMGWLLIGSQPSTPIEAVIEGDVFRIDSTYQKTLAGTRWHDASLEAISPQDFEGLKKTGVLTRQHDFEVVQGSNGKKSLRSNQDWFVANVDKATKQELAITAQELDQAASLAASKQQHYAYLADKLVSLAEQVAVLSGLYCDDAQNIGGTHTQMVSRWGNCGQSQEFGQADHLQSVLDQAQLDSSVANGAYLYYWQRKDTDAYDHTLSEVLGNGLVNRYEHNVFTGRPMQMYTHDNNQAIRELHYQYDAHNNVTYRNDLKLNIVDRWVYDALDRVERNTIDARGQANGHADFNGPFVYRYDELGNLEFKTGVGSYEYKGVNSGPHAVSKVNQLNYQYDKVGNLVRTYLDGSKTSERTLTWTEFNKPESITRNGKTVQFFYDANHNRYLKKSSDGSETLYFGKTYERVKDASGDVQHKHFVYADGKLIALNTQTRDAQNKLKNKQVRYLHYDALNSVDMITDGYGGVVERRSYDTWGKQRAITWTSDSPAQAITNRGYTGHEQIEEVGLIHMNGRVYDAELGRFLSADPYVQSPYQTNSFNRYSYVWNNPLKYTDPTGFNAFSDWVSDTWEKVKEFFSGDDESNGNGGGNGNDDRDDRHRNLEGDGIGFTVGYIGRAISGLFGGPGNTIEDQMKMDARTAETMCKRGRCGESELRRINTWNAHVNLINSSGRYVNQYIGDQRNHLGSLPNAVTGNYRLLLASTNKSDAYTPRSQMVKRSDGIWQHRSSAALIAAGLNPDTSYGCDAINVNTCAISGTLAGKGADEVTDLIENYYEIGGTLMELKNIEVPKQIEVGVYIGTFKVRFRNNKKYCSLVCNMQSFQRADMRY